MKKTYRITLIDSTNKHVAFRVLAADMATAIRAAQAKADDMPAGKISDEMRPSKPREAKDTKAPLRPSICALAAAGGAYVIVSSKGSTADSRLTERRAAIYSNIFIGDV